MAAKQDDSHSASDDGHAKKRTRILHACVNCGKKKTKCDGQLPCNVCHAAGTDCHYAEPKKRGPPKGYVRTTTKTESPAALRKRLADIEAQLRKVEGTKKSGPSDASLLMHPDIVEYSGQRPFDGIAVPPGNAVAGPSRDLFIQPPTGNAFGGYQYPPSLDNSALAAAAYASFQQASGMPPFAPTSPNRGYAPVPPSQRPVDLRRFSTEHPGDAGWYPPGTTTAAMPDVKTESPTGESVYYGSLSGRPMLASTAPFKAAAPKIDLGSTAAKIYGGEYQELDQALALEEDMPGWVHRKLLQLYLAYIHPLWPIVTMQSIRDFADDPGVEPMLFNAICALAACIFSDSLDPPEGERSAPKYTTKWLAVVFFNRARYFAILSDLGPTLATCQALIMMTLRENGCGRPAQGFQYCGMACRMAFDLGLHRKRDESEPHLDPDEAATRVRVYWACYAIDKMCAANLGRPVFMRREDSDVDLPTHYAGQDEDGLWIDNARDFVTPAVAHLYRDVQCNAFSNFYAFAGIARILEQIITRIYSFARRKQEQDVRLLQGLHNMLETWRNNLPEHLRWHTIDANQPSRNLPPHVLAVQTWFFTARLLLFRSFIPRFPACHAICNGAATEICRIIDLYEQNFGLQKVATSFVYATFSAAAMFAANLASNEPDIASEARRQLDQCIAWLDRLSATWQAASHHHRILVNLRDAGATGELRNNEAASEVIASRVPSIGTGPASILSNFAPAAPPLPASAPSQLAQPRPAQQLQPAPPAPSATAVPVAQDPPASGLDADLLAILEAGVPNYADWPHVNFGFGPVFSPSVSAAGGAMGPSALAGFNDLPMQPQYHLPQPVDASVNTFWRQMPLNGPDDPRVWDSYVEKYAEQVGEALAMRS